MLLLYNIKLFDMRLKHPTQVKFLVLSGAIKGICYQLINCKNNISTLQFYIHKTALQRLETTGNALLCISFVTGNFFKAWCDFKQGAQQQHKIIHFLACLEAVFFPGILVRIA